MSLYFSGVTKKQERERAREREEEGQRTYELTRNNDGATFLHYLEQLMIVSLFLLSVVLHDYHDDHDHYYYYGNY